MQVRNAWVNRSEAVNWVDERALSLLHKCAYVPETLRRDAGPDFGFGPKTVLMEERRLRNRMPPLA